MAKSGKASSKKPTPKAKSGKASNKSKAIKKSPTKSSAKASPAKAGSPSKLKWAAPYEKKIEMFKTQGDYFAKNAKYASM